MAWSTSGDDNEKTATPLPASCAMRRLMRTDDAIQATRMSREIIKTEARMLADFDFFAVFFRLRWTSTSTYRQPSTMLRIDATKTRIRLGISPSV